jgi:hypothetical protein
MTLRINKEEDKSDDLVLNTFTDAAKSQSVSMQPSCCVGCGEVIKTVSYVNEGLTYCQPCYWNIGREGKGSLVFRRLLLSLLFGSLASVLGGSIYFLVAWKTGYEFSLIAILIGFMVGIAVKKGSGGMGGWFYQTMAVFLTYCSVAFSYFALTLVTPMEDMDLSETVSQEVYEVELGGEGLVTSDSAFDEELEGDEAEEPEAFDEDLDLSGLNDAPAWAVGLLGWVAFFAFILSLPVLVGMESFMSLVILVFGMFEAWRQNRFV